MHIETPLDSPANPERDDAQESSPSIYKAVCPSRHLLSRIGDKWSVMVVLHLHTAPQRFGAIKRACEGVSQKMLTHTLRQLERDALLTRTVLQDKPLQVEYALTPSGAQLAVLIAPLVDWVHHHYPNLKAQEATGVTPHTPRPTSL